jgi:glycerol-3-phosphate dehydrogenase
MNRRNQILDSLTESEFDLVVIGAGLLGAGIALEATTHGFSVLLVDKDDFASGTSSRTSKIASAPNLLKGRQFGLGQWARNPAQISQLWQRAPHMVKDFAFVMPITPDRFLFSLKAQLGLALQDLRANVLGKARGHKRLSKKDTLKTAPALAPEIVTGAICFHDCFADDSRFVLELIKSATTKGATAVNYLEAKEFEIENGEVKSIYLRDRIEGRDIKVLPKAVVSACGVWTDALAKLIDPGAAAVADSPRSPELADSPPSQSPDSSISSQSPDLGHSIKTIRSTHIVLPPSALETGSALLLPTDGNRYVFVVPWQRALLVGTTQTAYEGEPDNPVPTAAEIAYLLDTINRYKRSGRRVSRSDVACAWAGLNIISSENYEGPQLFRGANGVITGFGGHLTDIQKMADLAVHFLTKKIGPGKSHAMAGQTKAVSSASMLGGFEDKEDYLTTTAEISARARKLGVEPASLDHLLSNYGKDALLVLDLIEQNPASGERICPDFPPLMAEVVHCVESEMAISLEDVLCRRIRLGFLHREQCLAAAPRVARMMQELCGWDSLRLKGELSALARNLASQLAPVS